MTITYDLDCGDETITLELLDDGTLICHSIDFDIEDETIAREMGFEPHPCFEAMDKTLWKAARDGDIDIVEILIAAGADIHFLNDYALRWASEYNHTDVVKLLLEYGADIHVRDDEALREAAEEGNTDLVKILLEHGADVHARDDEALCDAAREGQADTVKVLLEAGANVHARDDAALYWAAGDDDVVEILEDWIKDHG